MIPVFLLLAQESVEEKRKDISRSREREKEDFVMAYIYTCLFYYLVSLVSERVCGRENFPSVVRLRSES